MERMHSMFSNAFNTKAGSLIEKATASSLESEDWALNMQICDTVNSYEEGPKEAVKALKRRLSNNKNHTQVMYTLTVLETCVKNCNSRFHVLVMSKDFCNDILLKLFQKGSPNLHVQNKVLGLIQDWAESFKDNRAMQGVVEVYEQLKREEWEFPAKDKASAAPIFTPKRSVPPPQRQQRQPTHVHPQQARVASAARPASGPIKPSREQIAKLRSELEIVNGNHRVMSEMLSELNPTTADSSDIELLQELNRTCRAMQQRIMELIERVAHEELTVELLKVNDDLNNVFLRYERFERFRKNKSASPRAPAFPTAMGPPTAMAPPMSYPVAQPIEPPPSYTASAHQTPETNDLIDFGPPTPAASALPVLQPQQPTVPAVTTDLAGLSLDQFMAPPSQPASYPNLSQDLTQFESTAPAGPSPPSMTQAAEIEQWLQGANSSSSNLPSSQPPADSVDEDSLKDEFNMFLSERVAARENLPPLQSNTSAVPGPSETPSTDSRQRKMETGNQPMFGL